jgi:PKD repeat protein
MEGPGRQRIASLLLLVLVACLAGLASVRTPSALATVTNVIPMNGQQEPIIGDTIYDNEVLWAYVTSPNGGVVCVHRASDNPGGCNADTDAYAETPVLPFFAGIIPIQAGRLSSGEYMLVGAEAAGEPVTAVSTPFTVLPCPDCPPATIAKNSDFAIAAQSLLDSINTTCSLVKAASMLWRTKEVYAFAQVAIGGVGGGLGVGSVMVTAASGAGAVYDVAKGDDLTAKLPGKLGTVADGICNAAEKIQKFKDSSLGHWSAAWAADPPDPNFQSVTAPAFTDYGAIAGMPDWGFNAERANLDRIRSYAESSLHAYERFQGAEQAGGMTFQHAQSRAMGEDLLGFSHTLLKGAKFIESSAAQMRSEYPDVADRTVDQADIDAANTYVDRVRATGYTPGEIAQLHGLGLSDDAIARLKVDQTMYDPGNVSTGALDSAFDTLAAEMRNTAVLAEDFAADAWTFAGRSHTPPVADFDEGAHSGADGLTIKFEDTSTSEDLDPLTITWDFGDGETATGAQGGTVEHTYADEGPYTVTVTATDDYGADTKSRQISAGLPNLPPVASFTVTPQQGPVPLAVDVDATASSDPDGSIVSYQWDFGDSTVATGVTASHTYTSPSLEPLTVTLEVTDDRGATATTTRQVTPTGAPAAPDAADDYLDAAPTGVLDVLGNDEDGDGDTISVSANSQAAHGTVDCAALGGCTYTAESGFEGDDEFTYTVRDATGLEETATVFVTVSALPPAGGPVARNDLVSTRSETKVTFDVLANDAGTPPLTVDDVTQPAHGTAVCSPAGQCSYEPQPDYSGTDGFRYTIKNSDDLRSTADVHVTVAPPTAAFGVSVSGSPDPVASGGSPNWGVGASGVPAGAGDDALDALARPSVTATLSGAHSVKPSTVTTAPGWSAGQISGTSVTAYADSSAMLGEADTQLLAKPLPPTSQGTGGDGYVPILVGSKVFAFFHHANPTSVTCIDRTTGSRCPGYPILTNMHTTSEPGRGAVVGNRIYVTLQPSTHYPQTAPLGLYCWDAATAQPCGYVVVQRLRTTFNPSASGPLVVGGKIYFVADGGKLFCVDPATNLPCAKPAIPTGLSPDIGGRYDITSHGSRVYVSRVSDKVACIDVSSGAACPGWEVAKPLPDNRWNVVNRFNAHEEATGVCLVRSGSGVCYEDANPAAPTEIGWVSTADQYAPDTEAETGSRTLVAHYFAGVECWDWKTLAPCTGGDYEQDGWLARDIEGAGLPWAYGTAFDGSCVLGLGDPGLVFSVDPKGSSPCSSLGTTRTLDLRKQRCDGGVGRASWSQASLQDAKAGELSSVVLTVRDAASGQVLATKDISSGPLDLSRIDATAHPAITVEATARSAPGDIAWADAVPPRIRVSWQGDPKQLCFETGTTPSCQAAPVSVNAALGDVFAAKQLTLLPTGCLVPAPPPVPEVKRSTDLVLGCSDRRVVLEDVFIAGSKVRLLGVAAREFAGRKVRLEFGATRKAVATVTVGADGHFTATAPLPAKKLRNSNKARYVAKIGTEASLALKLARRMLVTRIAPAGDRVTIAGKVVGPMAAKPKDRIITLQRIVACKSAEKVKAFAPARNGSFSITVNAPAGQKAAVYRLSTRVRRNTKTKKLTTSFTLPRAVDFG